jgi:xylulose-5-phosphate/fructose-6-phosphate phosphoketolase
LPSGKFISWTIRCCKSRSRSSTQWLDIDAAIKHCTQGIGIWEWASTDRGNEPDVVMVCAGDVPTLETLAAVDLLRHYAPSLKIRVVNVVDLMTLQPKSRHPHGLVDKDYDDLFTKDKPVIFAFHGYPWLIHRLTYKRCNHDNIHVRGYQEEGSTTTPFDMAVRNGIDRFHLVLDILDRAPPLGASTVYVKQEIREKLVEHKRFIAVYGTDKPDVKDWRWQNKG